MTTFTTLTDLGITKAFIDAQVQQGQSFQFSMPNIANLVTESGDYALTLGNPGSPYNTVIYDLQVLYGSISPITMQAIDYEVDYDAPNRFMSLQRGGDLSHLVITGSYATTPIVADTLSPVFKTMTFDVAPGQAPALINGQCIHLERDNINGILVSMQLDPGNMFCVTGKFIEF